MSYAQKLRLLQRPDLSTDPASLSCRPASPPSLSRRASTLFLRPRRLDLRLRSYAGRERRGLALLLFRRYIFLSHRRGTLLPGPSSHPFCGYLALSAASIPSATRRETRRISSSGDFVDYNKCVCSSRRYKSQSSRPSFIPRSSPAYSPFILLRLLHQRSPIRPFGKTTTPTTTMA